MRVCHAVYEIEVLLEVLDSCTVDLFFRCFGSVDPGFGRASALPVLSGSYCGAQSYKADKA